MLIAWYKSTIHTLVLGNSSLDMASKFTYDFFMPGFNECTKFRLWLIAGIDIHSGTE